MNPMKILFVLTVLCICQVAGTSVFALPNKVVCTAAEAIGCPQDQPCIRGSADKLSLPSIWKLNFNENSFLSIMESGEEQTGVIIEVIKVEDALYLFGTFNDLAWSGYIDVTDWTMTLTGAGYDAGYIIHGFCNSKILE